ncbi:MAG: indolepyruvate ferredoxin oxidoreductase subunit alpha [Turicibacter sp.]|nr:indolepyruvate ferredoxin oxidoreductase subunit alpha [Turicibacter sp.]
MERVLLTGDEALARGAFEAGVAFASAYPGTPSTEILQNIAGYKEIVSEWAPNEKIAFEAAAGAAVAGVRSVASMKHVGVNVAADPLFTLSYTGIRGGMVLISADEPGMHSSQNEQDNRWYAVSAKVPMFEPSNSQECIDMMKIAFEVSEEFDTPVIIRVTTRICHSKSVVKLGERVEVAPKEYVKDIPKYVAVPALASMRRRVVETRMGSLAEYSEKSKLNFIEKGNRTGIIASGMCLNFAKEVFGEEVTYLNLGFTHPLPDNLLKEFYGLVDKVYVIEENDPYLQQWVERQGFECVGKPTIPPYGEMTPDVLRKAILGEETKSVQGDTSLVVPRPPVLCAGCPHRGFFVELGRKKNQTVVAGDIGCYTLGFTAPFDGIDYVICMGSAFSAGHGTQKALEIAKSDKRVVGIMGDSTFFHTGINGLMEVLYNGSKTICVILDNRTTGMTGHQDHPGTGRNVHRDKVKEMDIAAIAKAMGAKNVSVVDPNNLKEVRRVLDEAYKLDEPSVIIARFPCVLKNFSEEDFSEFGNDLFKKKYEVNDDKCITCKACIRVGCPAISIDTAKNKSYIDPTHCVGCSVCSQVCPKTAIEKMEFIQAS